MPFLLGKSYDKTIEDMCFAYDLDRDTYFGCRYVLCEGLCLIGMGPEESLKALYEFKGTITKSNNKKDIIRMIKNRK